MIKVANLNISQDNCGLYVIRLKGTDAAFFRVINNELWFILQQPNICKTSYSVTVSVEDLAGRFTPLTRTFTLNTPNCFCTSTTTTTTTSTPTTTTTNTPITTTQTPFAYPGNIVSQNAIYTQSSVWSQNIPATAATMNNRDANEIFETGTNNSVFEWIQMELSQVYNTKTIVVGCDFNNILRTGWGKWYTENLLLQHSMDGINWTNSINTGTFTEPMKLYIVDFTAKYIRLTNINKGGYISATEFAAGI